MARVIKIDHAELKRRGYKKRSHEKVNITCRILIVCEGSKTEPNYFEAFNKKRYGTVVFDLTFDGGGISTTQVVDKAIELRDKAKANNAPYDRVWAVFDKDSFSDAKFNAAIQKAAANDIECAWSNEAFELWYLLHFVERTTFMDRTKYEKAISEAINNSPNYKSKKKYSYAKNDPANYQIMNTYGSQSDAIKRASDLKESYEDFCYAKHNPCTTVFKLVEQLIGKDGTLNKELNNQI